MNTEHHMARMDLPSREEIARLQAVETAVRDLREQWSKRSLYGRWNETKHYGDLVRRLDECLNATPAEETAP